MINWILFIDEELIKWGWPEDVWFHVDKFSSAHVYLRLRHVSLIISYKFLTQLMQNIDMKHVNLFFFLPYRVRR